MRLKEQNILFFPRTMGIGGTEKVVLQLCEIFKPLVNKIVVCSCGGVHVSKLQEMGIKHYTFPDIEKKSLSTIAKVSRELKAIVKQENITVIHTHHRMAAFYVSFLKLYKKCVFINTSHGIFENKKKLTKYSYKNAHLIACGQYVQSNLVQYFEIEKERIRVISNSVKRIESTIEEVLFTKLHEEGHVLIGNIGRLVDGKGIEDFINAMPMILRHCPHARFLVIGSGEKEENYKKQVHDLHIENEVFFLGYCSDAQNLMKQMDLVVFCSLTEGLPLTPIEAFSVEKTIVATDIDSIKEIVKDRENGLLVTINSPKQIANNVCELINNPVLRRKLEEGAKKTFENKFSFEIFERNYVEYYRKVLDD